MQGELKNYAFVDGSNLHKGIQELGWRLDYKRFRQWLKDKFSVGKAYIFLGFIPSNTGLYKDLQEAGYVVVFKPTIFGVDGEVKGNCDAELVLRAVDDMHEKQYDKAVIVSGDGDFACLVNFLQEKDRLRVVLSPNARRASVLLKRAVPEKIIFLDRHKHKFAYHRKESLNEKAPLQD